MRQVIHQKSIWTGGNYLIASAGVFVAILLSLLSVDNIFWYKSATLFYAISSTMYMSYPLFRNAFFEKVSTSTLFLGLFLNLTGMIRRSIQSYELGVFHPPWSNLFEALTFWSFIAGGIYLFIERKYSLRILGTFVVPLVFVLSAFAIFKASKDITPLMPALRSYWLYLHVVTAFVGYAGFTVAFAGAVLYLIKGKFPETKLLPSQEVLEEITYKAIILVFPVWTASIILGSAWANEAWGGYWSWDPKEVWALIVWLFFGAYLHARQMLGWKGKRVAWMVILGFITVLVCFFAINLYFPGLHSYATD
ncbi:c-type cytochrome biogenesis protein CcsB [Hydrogenobacter thermophilus]|uniref:c-type cytochrome biogenesis protein CcsB n=1 Tax=Hydrogenobacter thermophilus TaxID=940 RepID=UPI0030F8B602